MDDQVNHIGLTHAVSSLPSEWYYDEVHFQRELQSVWRTNWLYVCSHDALREELSYLTLEIGKQSIIVLRDRDGDLRAYHNVCRHRGAKLLDDEHGALQSNVLICPYHQWSYCASSGNLRAITSVIEPEGFQKCDYGLHAMGLKVWRGLVYVNLDAEKPWNREDVFQDAEDILDDVPLGKLAIGRTWRKVVKCNWKIYWENYSECLHCPNVHPELSRLVPVYSRRLNSIKEAPDWQEKLDSEDPKYRGGLRDGAQTWSADGSAQGHAISSIENHEDLRKGHSYSTTWPAMFLGVYLDHVRTVRIVPIDAVTTELKVEWLFEPSALEDDAYDTSNVTDFAIRVMEQDAQISELNQQGVHSTAFAQGVLMPEEHAIKAFHDWLRRECGESPTGE